MYHDQAIGVMEIVVTHTLLHMWLAIAVVLLFVKRGRREKRKNDFSYFLRESTVLTITLRGIRFLSLSLNG